MEKPKQKNCRRKNGRNIGRGMGAVTNDVSTLRGRGVREMLTLLNKISFYSIKLLTRGKGGQKGLKIC